jgi:uncharacterized membrane protein YbhN (UPF0104 family)
MGRILWRILIWLWVRQAKQSYGGPGSRGELFNTACFQNAIRQTTGTAISSAAARMWLTDSGYVAGTSQLVT